jgi:hypothetical protein
MMGDQNRRMWASRSAWSQSSNQGGHGAVGGSCQVREALVVLGVDAAGLSPRCQHGIAGDPVTGLGFGDDGALEPQAIGQGLLGTEPGRDPGAEEGGRGLMIVTALCRDWGYFHTADGDKVVWADLPVPAKPLTPAGLPGRVREHAATAAPGAGLIRDPALLRRVHRALRNL